MNRFTNCFRKGCLTAIFSVTAAGISVAQVYEWSTFAGSSGGVGFRDGPPGIASVKSLYSAVTDPAGTIYLTDAGNHTIRVIAADGTVATLAGKGGFAGHSDGGGANARFSSPGGIARSGGGDLYVADTGNHVIRKISPAGAVTTLAGQPGSPGFLDGMGGNARFSAPSNLALSPAGDLFVADTGNHLIRRIAADGTVTTIGGQPGVAGTTDGPLNIALFNKPKGLEFGRNGTLYLADAGNRIIRQITPDGMVSTLAGVAGSSGSTDGIGSAARFYSPEAVTVDAAQNVWVSDTVSRTIRRISATNRMVTTVAGKDKAVGSVDGPGADARFIRPTSVAVAPDGSLLVTDSLQLRRIALDPALVTTLTTNPIAESGATDATGTNARFGSPEEVAVADNGDLFVAEIGNATIRRITPAGVVTTFAGTAGSRGTTDATGSDARFYLPKGLTFGSNGRLYVADSGNGGTYSLVRKITPDATVTTLAGSPGTIPSDGKRKPCDQESDSKRHRFDACRLTRANQRIRQHGWHRHQRPLQCSRVDCL